MRPLTDDWAEALRQEAPTVKTRVLRIFGHYATVSEAAADLTCKKLALGPKSQAISKGSLARVVEILGRRGLALACGCARLNEHRLTPCFSTPRRRGRAPVPALLEGQRLPLPEEQLGRLLAGYLRLFGIEVRMVHLDPIGERHTRIAVDVEPGDELGSLEEVVGEARRAAVEAALALAGGNKSRAAKMLGLGERHFFRVVAEAQGQCEAGPPSEAGSGVSRPG